jgi:hypothetical protein
MQPQPPTATDDDVSALKMLQQDYGLSPEDAARIVRVKRDAARLLVSPATPGPAAAWFGCTPFAFSATAAALHRSRSPFQHLHPSLSPLPPLPPSPQPPVDESAPPSAIAPPEADVDDELEAGCLPQVEVSGAPAGGTLHLGALRWRRHAAPILALC